jgi:hypothetical protein
MARNLRGDPREGMEKAGVALEAKEGLLGRPKVLEWCHDAYLLSVSMT